MQEFQSPHLFNLLYYDAFAPTVQPELWTTEIFKKLFNCMEPGGILVTYCSKGAVRRALTEAGFSVQKIPGPAHKREMIRSVRK
jgi:tRNA U34 5-methylaminomethyl-2-thiouridine-forming methyltransferase MnmC